MTAAAIAHILGAVTYKDWELIVGDTSTNAPYLQWRFMGPCAKTGKVEMQPCRKHRLSLHMTEGELVQTAFAAALQAEEHECREFFQYRGKRIFNPHLSIEALLSRADDEEVRQ